MTPDSTVAFGLSFGEPLSVPRQVQPLYGTVRTVLYNTLRYGIPACFSMVMVTSLVRGKEKETNWTNMLIILPIRSID